MIRLQPSVLNPATRDDLEWASEGQPQTHYPQGPENGVSIGIMEDMRAASLGMYVVLQSEGPHPRKTLCALTNYHAIAPADANLANRYYRTGASSGAPGITASVEHPSRGDLKESVQYLESYIEAVEESASDPSERDKLLLKKLRSK